MTAVKISFYTLYIIRSLHILAVSAILLAVASCGSQKQNTSTPYNTTEIGAYGSIPATQVLGALAATTDNDWTAVTMPVKLAMLSPVSASMSGRATLVRDKSMYISLRVLGMEVAYLYADSDSVFAADKVHRMYLAEDMASLSDSYGVSLSNIQDMLLGRVFELGGHTISETTTDRFTAKDEQIEERRVCVIEPRNVAPVSSIFITETDAYGLPSPVSFAARNGDDQMICYYGPMVHTEHGSIASDATLRLDTHNTSASARVSWTVKNAKWNDNASPINFKRPQGYTRVSAKELLKMLNIK